MTEECHIVYDNVPDEGKLKVTLMKATEGLSWPNLFHSEDPQGEEHLDPQLVEEVNQRLAHLTSDKFAADPELERPAYNPGQFEACDEVSEDLILIRLDGSTHAVSSIGFLGPTQHLFNSR
ncbi:NudC domain-containing protein 1, partial [Halocaridina rubra]